MQTLELDCPSCGEHLELDAGFAGGVCRCSKCGTLMTVPRDAGRAERLTAPERGAELSDATIDPADLQEIAAPPTPRGTGGKRGGRGRSKKKDPYAPTTIDAGEYRTASGKVVRVEQAMRVPMAQSKRKQIRMITTIVFMSIVLGIAVIAGVAILIMVSSGSGDGNTDNANSANDNTPPPPAYDSAANPFTLNFPNVAGIPIEGRVAIVVEASRGDSSVWLPVAGDMIGTGLSQSDKASTQVALYAAGKGKPATFASGQPTSLPSINKAELTKWFAGLTFDKPVDRTAAIELALKDKPDVLVLVFSGATGKELEAWQKLIEKSPGLAVHAVIIDSLSARPVQDWLRDHKDSVAISLSSSRIKTWKEDSQ